jgi:uncharacterized protein YuzE
MRIICDDAANAAYIQLADEIPPSGVARTYPCDPQEVRMINLDFDSHDRLVGIEIVGALEILPPECLAKGSDAE